MFCIPGGRRRWQKKVAEDGAQRRICPINPLGRGACGGGPWGQEESQQAPQRDGSQGWVRAYRMVHPRWAHAVDLHLLFLFLFLFGFLVFYCFLETVVQCPQSTEKARRIWGIYRSPGVIRIWGIYRSPGVILVLTTTTFSSCRAADLRF